MEIINVTPAIDSQNFFNNWDSTYELSKDFNVDDMIDNLKLQNVENKSSDEEEYFNSPPSYTPFEGTDNTHDWQKYYNTRHVDHYSNRGINQWDDITIAQNEYTVFEYIKKQIPSFYDNIKIEYKEFYDDKYNVAKVIKNNNNMFFNNNKFLDDDFRKLLDTLYKEYIPMFEKLFDDNNHVTKFLKSATMSNNKDSNSHFFIELFKEYEIFIPTDIAEIYFNKLIEYKDSDTPKEQVRILVKNILDQNKNNAKIILRKFREDLLLKIEEFDKKTNDVEYHLSGGSDYELFEEFTVDIMYLIIFYARKLIVLGVYPVHHIMADIIKQYTKMDLDYFTHNNNKLAYSI